MGGGDSACICFPHYSLFTPRRSTTSGTNNKTYHHCFLLEVFKWQNTRLISLSSTRLMLMTVKTSSTKLQKLFFSGSEMFIFSKRVTEKESEAYASCKIRSCWYHLQPLQGDLHCSLLLCRRRLTVWNQIMAPFTTDWRLYLNNMSQLNRNGDILYLVFCCLADKVAAQRQFAVVLNRAEIWRITPFKSSCCIHVSPSVTIWNPSLIHDHKKMM